MWRSGGVYRRDPQPVQSRNSPQLIPATAAPSSPPIRQRDVQQSIASAWQVPVVVVVTHMLPPLPQSDPAPILSRQGLLATIGTSHLSTNDAQRRRFPAALYPAVAAPQAAPVLSRQRLAAIVDITYLPGYGAQWRRLPTALIPAVAAPSTVPIVSCARLVATINTSYRTGYDLPQRRLPAALIPAVPGSPPLTRIRGMQQVVQASWPPLVQTMRKAIGVATFIPAPPAPSVTGTDSALSIGMGIHL